LSLRRIKKNVVVTLDYEIKDTDGNIVDNGNTPFEYLHGKYEKIFPQIEKALEGHTINDKLSLTLSKDAFGQFDDDLVLVEDASLLPKNIKLGSVFKLVGEELILIKDTSPPLTQSGIAFKTVPQDERDSMTYRVTDLAEGKVVLDGNHLLAGTELCFSIVVTNIRAATPEEIKKGHVYLR